MRGNGALSRVPLLASGWVYTPEMKRKVGQEKMEDEVFELREPLQRDSHLTIEVVLDGKSKEYNAKLGAFWGRSRTLAEALHQLANRLDGARVYGSEVYSDEEILTGKRLRCCEYCGAPIFFAKTPNEKWMPVEGSSVEASQIKGMRCFSILDIAGTPHVQWLSRPQGGQVWFPHPEVCGLSDIAPPHQALWDRWQTNRKRVVERQETAVRDLQSLVNDLEPEEEREP